MMLLEQMGDANIRGDYGCPQLFTPILRGVPARPVAATAAHRLPEVLSMNSVHLTCCIHGKHTRLLFRCRESTGSLNWHAGLAASLVPIFIFDHTDSGDLRDLHASDIRAATKRGQENHLQCI